jgi:multidrug efflux pump subunit AcrA (membrane-fusion protein)
VEQSAGGSRVSPNAHRPAAAPGPESRARAPRLGSLEPIKAQRSSAVASLAQAKAQRDQAQLNLSYTTVTAAQSGRVVNLTAAVGQFAQPGTNLTMFVPGKISCIDWPLQMTPPCWQAARKIATLRLACGPISARSCLSFSPNNARIANGKITKSGNMCVVVVTCSGANAAANEVTDQSRGRLYFRSCCRQARVKKERERKQWRFELKIMRSLATPTRQPWSAAMARSIGCAGHVSIIRCWASNGATTPRSAGWATAS